MKMKLNQVVDTYLKPGARYCSDNLVFVNCPPEFFALAEKSAEYGNNPVKSCFVRFDSRQEQLFEEMLDLFELDYQKSIMARTFVASHITLQVMKALTCENSVCAGSLVDIENGINAFEKKDKEKIIEFYRSGKAPFPSEIDNIISQFGAGAIEINLFLPDGLKNKMLQQNINVYIGSRLPFCIKIFTKDERLASNLCPNDTYIQCPHDYSLEDCNKFDFSEHPRALGD